MKSMQYVLRIHYLPTCYFPEVMIHVVKVWDRRSMAGGREAGCLPGHMEGITFVATKGDGRYVISNSKDQTLKLWDIRKMMERSDFDALPQKRLLFWI